MKVIVIGGGPAGMLASIAAAQNGEEVILIETKIFIMKGTKIKILKLIKILIFQIIIIKFLLIKLIK